MSKTAMFFRFIFSLLLLAGVYSETGIFTTIAVFLICVHAEIVNRTVNTMLLCLKKLL
jgi:hypothetical protein